MNDNSHIDDLRRDILANSEGIERLRRDASEQMRNLEEQLAPHELAKKIDQSHFSINFIRVLLQCVGVLFTIFAGILGIVAIYGLLDFRSLTKDITEQEARIAILSTNLERMVTDVATLEDSFQGRVSKAQAQANRELQQFELAISNALSSAQQSATSAESRLTRLQSDLENIVVRMLENEVHEKIPHTDTNRVWYGHKTDGAFFVFYRLNRAAIGPTIQISVGENSLVQGDYQLFGNNILSTLWSSNSADAVRSQAALIRYIADPRKEKDLSDFRGDIESKRVGFITGNTITWIDPVVWIPREEVDK